ncbi:hypothetical protein GIB67_010215 [Kingdonia uniflora]|uniref:Uncharacterized protein n=1 Tax=Kingdonia uniflora TaxID=39325 RepID=A0A7J7NAR9_9MAGN|nr:hypothetical protein GIB67_010215 [Kingdonia uniflora]
MGSRLQNPKIALTRNKILGEKIGTSGSVMSNTHFYETPIIESSPPYDPLSNYLSPRPKFLRYNPNRHAEILLRREKEMGKEGNGFAVDEREEEDSSSYEENFGRMPYQSQESDSEESNSEREDDGYSDEENGDEEEEERCWLSNKVMKFLLVLGVLFFSTAYLSSMNSPTASNSMKTFWRSEEIRRQEYVFQIPRNSSVEMEKPWEISDEMGEYFYLYEGGGVLEITYPCDIAVVKPPQEFEHDRGMQDVSTFNEDYIDEGIGELLIAESDAEKVVIFTNETSEIVDVLGRENVETINHLQVSQIQLVPNLQVPQTQLVPHSNWQNSSLVYDGMCILETVVNSNKLDSKTTIKTEFMSMVAVGIGSVVLLIGFCWKKCRKHSKEDSPLTTTQPSFESSIVEERVLPLIERQANTEDQTKKDDYCPSSSVHSVENEELNRSRAPTVELLGDYVVEDLSSSFKRCNLVPKPIQDKENQLSQSHQENKSRRTRDSSSHCEHTGSNSEFAAQKSPVIKMKAKKHEDIIQVTPVRGDVLMNVANTPVPGERMTPVR